MLSARKVRCCRVRRKCGSPICGPRAVPWIGSTGAGIRHLQPEDEELAVSGRDPEQLDAEARSSRPRNSSSVAKCRPCATLAVAESSTARRGSSGG